MTDDDPAIAPATLDDFNSPAQQRDDAAWFKANQGRSYGARLALPGELGALTKHGALNPHMFDGSECWIWCLLRQEFVEGGLRISRTFIALPARQGGDEPGEEIYRELWDSASASLEDVPWVE